MANFDEMISKAERFALDFIAKISDKSEQPARKQLYFLDNQEDLQKCMGGLQKVVTKLGEQPALTEDSEVLLLRAQSLIDSLKKAIADYQQELTIDNDITDEDTTAVLSQETISDAMENNKTTQEITANMQAIAENQKAAQIGYNYALVCDGQINMIGATSKSQLVDSINAIANSGSYKDIQLYKMTFTPVPLKQQTILTV